MPRAPRGAWIACEGFRKRSANAIEFGRFTQHDRFEIRRQIWRPPSHRDASAWQESAFALWRFGETGMRLVRTRSECRQLLFDLGERARELLPARGMSGALKLTAQFGIGQAERFCAA